MNEDCLKLTTCFGERRRTGRGFLADELLDLYGRREIATSVMLRGIAGFGLRHQRRTDRLLSMSESPPVAVSAVDTADRIDAILDDVLAIKKRGLLTLERARMIRDDIGPVTLPEELHEATKLTIHAGRHERIHGAPAYIAVCDLLHRRGLAEASVFLGVDGTVRGQRERAQFLRRNTAVPLMIIAVGTGAGVTQVLPELGALLRRPMITVERVRVCKRDGQLFERPHSLPGTDIHGLGVWQKLMIYTSEAATYRGQPLHRAIVRRLRETRTTRGATALRGIWGFHGDHLPHGDRVFQLARRVPVTTVIVDTPERIAAAFDIVDHLTNEQGLVTSEMVPALLSLNDDKPRGGTRLARHDY